MIDESDSGYPKTDTSCPTNILSVSNSIGKRKTDSISLLLYDLLMRAENWHTVALSGTPIINYPNEIAVLYNMLRGYINSYVIPIKWEKKEKLNSDTILNIMDKENI